MFKLTFDARQDVKRFLAIGGISLALVIGTSGIADAAKVSKKDGDRDGLVSKVEVKYTDTSPPTRTRTTNGSRTATRTRTTMA